MPLGVVSSPFLLLLLFLLLTLWDVVGVFENRPADVAEWFAEYLFSPDSPFHNRFAKVVFAILDNKGGKIIEPFYQKFGTK